MIRFLQYVKKLIFKSIAMLLKLDEYDERLESIFVISIAFTG